MLIIVVLKNNRNLPQYNYYLGIAEYLLCEGNEQVKKSECLWNIDEKIQEIEKYIAIAIRKYRDENSCTISQGQKNGFNQKKEKIKNKLDKLKVDFEKKKRKMCRG